MYFYEIMERIMNDKNLKVSDVAKLCDLPDSTIRSIFVRKQKSISLEVAFKLSKGLNVSLEILNGDSIDSCDKSSEATDNDEQLLLLKYRKLDDIDKAGTIGYIDAKLEHEKYKKLLSTLIG